MRPSTAGLVATIPRNDLMLPPGSRTGRARRRGGKVQVFIGDSGGSVRVSRQGADLYHLAFFDEEGDKQANLFVSADELARIEFTGDDDSMVELEGHLPFALLLNEAGNVEVRDRRHALGGTPPPARLPYDSTLVPAEAMSGTPPPERWMMQALPPLGEPVDLSLAPAPVPTGTARWTPVQLNPHIRLV